MNKLLIISLLCFSYPVSAQKLHLNFFAGVANYKGDLQYNSRSGKQHHTMSRASNFAIPHDSSKYF